MYLLVSMAGIKNDNLFFPHYSIAAINCNSLNISTISSCHFKLKLYGIVKLRTDFILLSDTRLNCEIRSQDVRTVNKTFLVNPYKSYNFFHNSLSAGKHIYNIRYRVNVLNLYRDRNIYLQG